MPTDIKVKISALDPVTDASPLSTVDSEVEFYVRDGGKPIASRDRRISRDRMRLEVGGLRIVGSLPASGSDGEMVLIEGFGRWEWLAGANEDYLFTGATSAHSLRLLLAVGTNSGSFSVFWRREIEWTPISGMTLPAGASDVNCIAYNLSDTMFYVASNGDAMIYKASWGNEFGGPIGYPSGVTDITGMTFDADNNMLVVASDTDKVYKRSGGSWDAGTATPATNPQALATKSNGDWILAENSTYRIYVRSNGVWVILSSLLNQVSGLAVDEYDNIIGVAFNLHHTGILRSGLIPYIWSGSRWKRTAFV